MTHTDPASDRQKNFITDLLKEKEVPAALEPLVTVTPDTKGAASSIISILLQLPKKAAPVSFVPVLPPVPVVDRQKELTDLLVQLPFPCFYALENDAVVSILDRTRLNGNDLLFLEVRKYGSRIYMRRLLGSPGGFARYRVDLLDSIALAKLILVNPVEASKRFAMHYGVCGRCGAALTDPVSRMLWFGPTCCNSMGISRKGLTVPV